MVPDKNARTGRRKKPAIHETMWLGCRVCATRCRNGAMRLVARKQRVIAPETTFHRVILSALERGTLQNQLFDDARGGTQAFLCALVGGLLRLTRVKRALLSDALRSHFLRLLEAGVQRQGGEALWGAGGGAARPAP